MTLTESVLAVQAGTLDWNRLFPEIYRLVASYSRARQLSEDEAHEFFYANLDRFKRMVEGFADQGAPFEAYLGRCLGFMLKTFKQQCAVHRSRDLYAGAALYYEAAEEGWDQMVETRLFPESNRRPNHDFSDCSPGQKRQIIVGLRNCFSLDDARCQALAEHTGVGERWLMECRDRLRLAIHEDYAKKRDRFDRQVARRVQSLQRGTRGPVVQAIACYPKHSDIAAVLGIPKGTVDSAMHTSRQLLAKEVVASC